MEAWTLKATCEYLKCGRAAVNGLVKRGLLRKVKIGNRIIFAADQVKALLTGEAAK